MNPFLILQFCILLIFASAEPPPNDLCENAALFYPGPVTVVTAGSTPTELPREGLSCGDYSTNGDVWFQYTAPQQGKNVRLHTCSEDFHSVVDVYSSCNPDSFSLKMDCSEDNFICGRYGRQIHVDIEGGATIYIRVHAVEAANNETTFRLHHNLKRNDFVVLPDDVPNLTTHDEPAPTPFQLPPDSPSQPSSTPSEYYFSSSSGVPTAPQITAFASSTFPAASTDVSEAMPSPTSPPEGIHPPTCSNDDDCVRGRCSNSTGHCACSSGAVGDNCQYNIDRDASCEDYWDGPQLMLTRHYPTLNETSGMYAGNLFLLVHSPLVINRFQSTVFLDDFDLHPQCAWPSSVYWQKIWDYCDDTWALRMPWVENVHCGWEVDSTSVPGRLIHTNWLMLRHLDWLANFRGVEIIRDTIHSLPLMISFPTSIEVSTDITVYSEILLLAAISSQSYDPETRLGRLENVYSLQWPYYLTNLTILGIPEGMTANYSEISDPALCLDQQGASCEQRFEWSINPGVTCTLSGTYRVQFWLACRGPASDCPLMPGEEERATPIEMTVTSEDVCPKVQIDVGIAGQLTIYEDPEMITTKYAFLHDQVAYARAVIEADVSINITTTELVEIRLFDGIDIIYLVQDGVVTQDGVDMSFTWLRNENGVVDFAFTPNAINMPVPLDDAKTYTLTVVAEVSFIGSPDAAGQELKKRFGGEGEQTRLIGRQVGPGDPGQVRPQRQSPAASSTMIVGSNGFPDTITSAPVPSVAPLQSGHALPEVPEIEANGDEDDLSGDAHLLSPLVALLLVA